MAIIRCCCLYPFSKTLSLLYGSSQSCHHDGEEIRYFGYGLMMLFCFAGSWWRKVARNIKKQKMQRSWEVLDLRPFRLQPHPLINCNTKAKWILKSTALYYCLLWGTHLANVSVTRVNNNTNSPISFLPWLKMRRSSAILPYTFLGGSLCLCGGCWQSIVIEKNVGIIRYLKKKARQEQKR